MTAFAGSAAAHTCHADGRDAEAVVAVVDPARVKSGTASTMSKAGRAGKPLIVVDVTAKRTRIVRPTTGPGEGD